MILSEMIEGKRVTRECTPQFTEEYDVIVCGLGTAGSLAALFAAENGLCVLGVEQFTCVGGIHTVGGIGKHYFGHPGGRYEELDRQVAEFAARFTCTPQESRKLVLEQMLLKNSVTLSYESMVCGVYLEGSTVTGVRVLTEQGMVDYKAKLVMDCTADATVAVMAGCETECGRASDGQMQPYSIVSLTYDGKGYGYTNVDFGRVDQNDERAFSQAILFARSYPIREKHAGKELLRQMPLPGFREGRRILAEERVTVEELFADRQTETPMFYSYADLDKHGRDLAFDGEALGDWTVGANLGAYNVTVAVPYRALLPKGYEGLLVPCRALGVDRDISSCVRMIPDMKKVAETAAEWATLATRQNKTLREVSYEDLKERLLASGCLNPAHNCGVVIDFNKNKYKNPSKKVVWCTDPAKLEEGLKTLTPGQAIWSAGRIGDAALPYLRELIKSEDENTAKHAAFALAMLKNGEGTALLRQMAAERDGVLLQDCRKNNNLRGCMAIYWLGRLAERAATEELIGLICDPDEQRHAVYHSDILLTRYKIADFDAVYFQFISQAVMALVRIGDAHPDLRERISEGFRTAFSTEDYYHRITQRPKESSEGNAVLTVQRIALSAVEKWTK